MHETVPRETVMLPRRARALIHACSVIHGGAIRLQRLIHGHCIARGRVGAWVCRKTWGR